VEPPVLSAIATVIGVIGALIAVPLYKFEVGLKIENAELRGRVKAIEDEQENARRRDDIVSKALLNLECQMAEVLTAIKFLANDIRRPGGGL
jgi:hypothetical protein